MPIRRVLTLGELDRGQPCDDLNEIDAAARLLAADLIDTMRSSPGCVGLAAPQIGANPRAFVLDVTENKKTEICHGEFVMFNPRLILLESPVMAREGCLSVPDLTGDVARASRVVVRGVGLDGAEFEIATDAFEARAVLHEIDHLDGLVFLDRVSGPDRLHVRRVYR